MLVWLRKLLYDEATFTQYARVVVFLIGEALVSFGPSAKYYWLGKLIQGSSLVMRAGDPNPPKANG